MHQDRVSPGDPLYNSVAPLRTVQALATMVTKLQNRQFGLPGMGCLSGWSGFGKTSAALWATNAYGCVNVQVQSSWSAKFFCERVLVELGERNPRGTIGQLVMRINELLAVRDVPLLIDEADHLMRRRSIEIVRDIYEGSQVPVILIGEEEMPQKLRAWDRIHNRVGDWALAQPANLDELYLLAKIYAADVYIEEDLAEHILHGSARNLRRISTNLADAADLAIAIGKTRLSRADWGDRPLFTGTSPLGRNLPQ